MLLLVHAVAVAYGHWPHEVLELEPAQLALAVACVDQWEASTAQAVQRATSAGAMIFPTLAVRP